MKRLLLIGTAATLLFSSSTKAQYIAELKASEASISRPFVLTNGYLLHMARTEATNGGRAVFVFTAPSAGQYAIAAIVEASSPETRSMFLGIDSEPTNPASKWEIPVKNGFATNLVTSATGTVRYFDLTPGNHQLIIRGSSPNVKLSSIAIAQRPSPPSNLHIVTGSH